MKEEFKREIDNLIEARFDFSNKVNPEEEYQKIVSKINFEKQEKEKKSLFHNKKILIPIYSVICLLLVFITSLTTIKILKNKENNNVIQTIVSNDEYIKAAQDYMIDYCDYVNPLPEQLNYVGTYAIFGIYKGTKFADNELKTLYFVQLYSLTQNLNDCEVILTNQQNIQFTISADGVNDNVMKCLNDLEDFVKKNEVVSINGYFENELIMATNYIF